MAEKDSRFKKLMAAKFEDLSEEDQFRRESINLKRLSEERAVEAAGHRKKAKQFRQRGDSGSANVEDKRAVDADFGAKYRAERGQSFKGQGEALRKNKKLIKTVK